MTITPTTPRPLQGNAAANAAAEGSASKSQRSGSAADGDRVSLQSASVAQQASEDLGVIDEARVEQVRAQIENGTYKIDLGAIADRILAETFGE